MPTRSTERHGPRSGARSVRSRRTPASSTRITPCVRRAAAKALAAALGPHKATIHRNHGLFTVGHTVDEAAWWFITMERSCQAQLLAEAAGPPVIIDDEGARHTRDFSASPYSGWLSFQPLWDEICRSDPDLFE